MSNKEELKDIVVCLKNISHFIEEGNGMTPTSSEVMKVAHEVAMLNFEVSSLNNSLQQIVEAIKSLTKASK
tara:strand:+ start:693 stop:905 length:213 start_codon:yes stop_codon:yes gene_type:complete